MFRSVSSFLRRHKRKFFVLGGLVGGIAVLQIYLKRKFEEWQSKRALEYVEIIQRSSHFEGAMRTCDTAIVSFAPRVRELVCNEVDINPVVEKLKQNPPDKVELWENLKVLVFTQAVGEMYTQCLLTILLRIQISILSGYTYSRIKNNNSSDDSGKHQKYMSNVIDFLVTGVKDLLMPIERATYEVLHEIPLNRKLKLAHIEHFLTSINDKLVDDLPDIVSTASRFLTNQNESESNGFLNKISIETKDVLECDDFNCVLSESIKQGTAALMDRSSECYAVLCNDGPEFVNLNELAVPLAKIIPMMHNVFSQHPPDEQGGFIPTLLQQEALKSFAANIYESFSQEDAA